VAADGADPVPAGLVETGPAGVAADPDDAAAQPATGPATASTASAEAAARRAQGGWGAGAPHAGRLSAPPGDVFRARGSHVHFVRALNGISFVTFQMTLYPPARLYRVLSV
jgi:hypothetical protein